MDYTKVPQQLIYQNRLNLEDFVRANKLTAVLIENMENIDTLTNDDFENSALDCMNAAYYICTLIMLEKRPEWRWGYIKNFAGNVYKSQPGEFLDIIIVLVNILIEHKNDDWKKQHTKIMSRLAEYVRPLYFKDMISIPRQLPSAPQLPNNIWGILNNGITSEMALPDNEFAPCKIDDGTISKVSQFSWGDYTNKFEERIVFDFLTSLGQNNTEKLYLVELIKEKAFEYFGKDHGFLPIFDKLFEYERDIRDALLVESYDDIPERDTYEIFEEGEIPPDPWEQERKLAQDEIDALKEENRLLKLQLPQQAEPADISRIEELETNLSAAQDYIKELEEEKRELNTFKEEMEELPSMSSEKKLAIDERAIFFTSAIGLDFDPKRTNQKQLSIMISTLSGDNPESIRGRISKMHKMEKNNRFSEEVLQAARNVKGLLEKVPQGNQPQKLKDIIDNIDLVFLNSNNS